MIKRLLILMVVLLWAACAWALDPGFVGLMSQQVTGPTYSDILFYHNADSWATTPTKGTGVIVLEAWSSNVVETTSKLAGTGSLDTQDDGYGRFKIPISGNLNPTECRVGFWLKLKEDSTATHRILSLTDAAAADESTGELAIYILSGGGIRLIVNGTQFNSTTSVTNGNAYFIEFSIHNSTLVALYVNGNSEASGTSASATHNGTYITLMSKDSMLNSYWDQIIFSNDYLRDIYAIRTVTNFN